MLFSVLIFSISIYTGELFDLPFEILDFLDILHFFELKSFLLPTNLHLISLYYGVDPHFVLSLKMLFFFSEISIIILLQLKLKLIFMILL